jgi:hypothetical protein
VDPSGDGRGALTAAASCGSCGTELPPNSKFCNECGAPLEQAAQSAEYKQVAVLFADVVHSIELAASRMASMTANEVRDHLEQRFRPARPVPPNTAPRGGVVLRHLDDAEKPLLERCSVFAGKFDLESACAAMGSDDYFATRDLLDALVRKPLLIADRSSGRTRF